MQILKNLIDKCIFVSIRSKTQKWNIMFDFSNRNEIARVDLKSAAYDHEVIHKFDYELEVNSMDLRDNYLYFVNPVQNSVQRIDVTVPGSLLNRQDLPEGQTTHRLVALQDVTC